MGALVAEHEVHEVAVAGAFLLSLLALPTPRFLLVALRQLSAGWRAEDVIYVFPRRRPTSSKRRMMSEERKMVRVAKPLS
jgi:hypothetical protein